MIGAQHRAHLQLRHRPAGQLARGLGWFSIGLGLAELLAPRLMARATGLDGREILLRAYGLREIANGIALLVARRPAPWVWARVAGDALDLATLGERLRHADGARRGQTAAALVATAGVAAVDVGCALALGRAGPQPAHDYSDRRGLPLPPAEMRGLATLDFETPSDYRTPEALRPYTLH